MTVIRSALFVLWMYGLIVVMGTLGLWLLLCPRTWVRAYYRFWLALVFGGLRVICGLRFVVEGTENLPEGGALRRYTRRRVPKPPSDSKGVIGSPSLATPEKGRAVFTRYVEKICAAVAAGPVE